MIFCDNCFVVDDLNLVLNSLFPEILRIVIFSRKLATEFAHPLDFGDGKMLSRQTWSINGLVDECHEDISLNVLPILLEHGMKIVLGSSILLSLEIQSSHDEVHPLVQTT